MNVNHVAVGETHQVNDNLSFSFANTHQTYPGADDAYVKTRQTISGGAETYKQVIKDGDFQTTLVVDNNENRIKVMAKNTRTGEGEVQEFIYKPEHSGGHFADATMPGSASPLADIKKEDGHVQINVGNAQFDLREEFNGYNGDLFKVTTKHGDATTTVSAHGADPKDPRGADDIEVEVDKGGGSFLETFAPMDGGIKAKVLALDDALKNQDGDKVIDILSAFKSGEGDVIARAYKNQTDADLQDRLRLDIGNGDHMSNQDGNQAGYAEALLRNGGDTAAHQAYKEIKAELTDVFTDEKKVLSTIENLGEGRSALVDFFDSADDRSLKDSAYTWWAFSEEEREKLNAMLPDALPD